MYTQWLQNIIDSIAIRGRELLGLDIGESAKQSMQTLCMQLLTGRGEASGIALSQEILHRYSNMGQDDKLRFFQMLAKEFEPDLTQILNAVNKYQQEQSAQNLIDLNAAVEAPRQELFRRLNMAPNGTATLVAMRADLLGLLKENPSLKSVDADFKHLLSSWFNRGFLQLRDIDWTSPAHILEKLINYESVHEIQGWPDLRRRLMKDRRCFAFFHPAMPDEPLIFIEVAFVQGLSSDIKPLLDPESPVLYPSQADTAIFYSINNTQHGLRGISFGNFLIKHVLTELANGLPWIKISSTLSPIPSFAQNLNQWLNDTEQPVVDSEFNAILQQHRAVLEDIANQHGIDSTLTDKALLLALLGRYPVINAHGISEILNDLVLIYLTTPGVTGKLLDPVAMFHLSNGARLERINTQADMSAQGISNSYGVMVNYLYHLQTVEVNHEAFVSKGKVMLSEALAKKRKQLIKEKA